MSERCIILTRLKCRAGNNPNILECPQISQNVQSSPCFAPKIYTNLPKCQKFSKLKSKNFPGVAGAVIQTSSLLINSLTESPFPFKSSKHHYIQTVRARELTFLENVNPPRYVACQGSCVTHIYIFVVVAHSGRASC